MRAVIVLVTCVLLSATTASADGLGARALPERATPASADPPASRSAEGSERASADSPARASAEEPTAFAARLARWVDVDVGYISVRYRHLDPSTSAPTADQFQLNDALRARFKFDAAGRYGVVMNATSGSGFVGGWDSTGIGTGRRNLEFFVRHLYVDARPADALTIQFGSLPVARGHFTELTGFDGDAYIAGERVAVRAPARLYVDEIILTTGYVGDLSSPNFFDRRDRFDQVNYYQAVLSKRFGQRVAASLDYTDLDGGRTLSSAVRIETPRLGVVRGVRYEQYVRLNQDASAGFALAADGTLPGRGRVEAGFLHIDRRARPLNGDRYGVGTRVFASASVPLSTSFTASTFATYAFTSSYGLPNKIRFDLILTWNILKDLQRHGLVK